MKTIHTFLIVFFIGLLTILISCEEEGPYINFEPIDTSLLDTTFISSTSIIPDEKNVLIEDFTGARCPNCPNAAAKLVDITMANPGRIVGMAIHPDGIPFTRPHDLEKDFRTDDGTEIFKLLGEEGALPIGSIDRVKYSGETNQLVGISFWANYVDQRLLLASPVNISLVSTPHLTEANTFVIRAEVQFTTAIADDKYLTIALTESDLIAPQTLPQGSIPDVDSNYINNHILRDVLTNPGGNLLMSNPEMNRVFIKEFKITMDAKWNPDNCAIVGIIHNSGLSFDVDQVEEIHLK
ncbi:MAG: Omp28-related outer membrane protein [Bacteroidetes bacterium]|jgi:hypothetical protein|nr:Omp28-related outer membrane protein [Bacteroidota bacterium]MBT7994801.1 Omp28-related outer membrane protein [Bacteroidota bacterium]